MQSNTQYIACVISVALYFVFNTYGFTFHRSVTTTERVRSQQLSRDYRQSMCRREPTDVCHH